MTDTTSLMTARLRGMNLKTGDEAAELLEQYAARIAELEARLASQSSQPSDGAVSTHAADLLEQQAAVDVEPQPSRAELDVKISAFLAHRSVSDGGWAPVADTDIEALGAIVNALIEAKYEYDPDGDLPVSAYLLDRTKYERVFMPYYRHLPDGWGSRNPADAAEYQRVLMANISMANTAIRSASEKLDIMLKLSQGR